MTMHMTCASLTAKLQDARFVQKECSSLVIAGAVHFDADVVIRFAN